MNRLRVWILAVRPRTLAAAAAPVLAGSGLAAADGSFAGAPALAALAGALLIQIGTNLANDYYDFIKGSDTGDRIGPTRVTHAGLLPPESVHRGMVSVLSLALLIGCYLVWAAGWPVVIIGLASLICAVAYTAGPCPLAYLGLGDLFVFVFFGPVAVAGTYYVQALSLSPGALLAGVGLGAFSTAILVVNNLRDRETDQVARKHTLAVRFGDRFTRAEYAVCLAVATAVSAAGVLALSWPPLTLLSLVGVVACVRATGRVFRFADRRALNPALEHTARGVALYGSGLAVGFLFGQV